MENGSKYEGLMLKNQLCFPVYACSRMIIKRYGPMLRELELTYTQYIVMMVLWETRQVSMKELGARLYLDSGTLTPVIRSLEEKGLAAKERDPADERSVNVTLSGKGLELREKAADIPAQMASCVKLEPDEAASLYGLLYKLLGSIPAEEHSL